MVYIVAQADYDLYYIYGIFDDRETALNHAQQIFNNHKARIDVTYENEPEELRDFKFYDRYIVQAYKFNQLRNGIQEQFSEIIWDSEGILLQEQA